MPALPTKRTMWSVLGIYLVLTALQSVGAQLLGSYPVLDGVREFLSSGVAAIGSWGGARRARAEPRAALGWWWFSAGIGVVALQHVASAAVPALRLGLGTKASTLVQLFSTLSFPITAIGMALWPLGSATRRGRLRKGLNGVVFALSAFFTVWVLGLRAFAFAPPATMTVRVFSMFNFALASSMLGLVVYYGTAVPARLRGPLGWAGTAVLTYSALQVAWIILTGEGNTVAAGWLAFPRTFAFALVAAAPFSPVSLNGDQPWDDTRETSEGGLVLVYAPALIALTAGVIVSIAGGMQGDGTAAVLAVLIGVTLMLRQFFTVRDFAELSRTLEERVKERTRELEEAHRALAHAQRMDALGRLAGGVAHDFNNLLTAIRGYAELIVTEPEVGEALRGDAREIANAADRGAALTRQLLTFARKQMPELSVVDLGETVSRVSDLLRRLLPATIQLTVRRSATPARVMMDPAQLEQIVVNLAVNARDAMPRGGELTVETAHEPALRGEPARDVAGLPHRGAWAILRVVDSGVGMSAETLSHLFEPFFTTKPAGSGTGLGLATSYGIARQAGGVIRVRSEVGKGSAFEVILPAVEAESRVARLSPVGVPVMTGGTPNAIAVADADPAVRDLVGRTMRDLGYRVHLAADVDALGEVRRQLAGCLRLLITDGAPGSAAERDLRTLGVHGPGSPVPVVRLHRHAAPAPDEGNGAHWLAAPFTAAELVDAVRDALGHGVRG